MFSSAWRDTQAEKRTPKTIRNEASKAPKEAQIEAWRAPGEGPGGLWAAPGRQDRSWSRFLLLLGGSWGAPGAVLAAPGAILARLGPLLGRPGRVLGLILASFEGLPGLLTELACKIAKTLKIAIFSVVFQGFGRSRGLENRSKIGPRALRTSSWRLLGALGRLLGASWPLLAALGPLLACLEAILKRLSLIHI